MPDNNLSSSITALVNQIKTEIPTSSAENLKRLARSIRKLGHSGDSTIDTLINTRANALVASATPSELQILSEAVNLVDDTSNPTAATNVNADVHVSDTAPASAVSGDLWWKTDELNLYIYYEDTDGAQWIQANSTVITGTIPTDVSDLTDTTSLLGSGGASVVATHDLLPSSPSAGDMALVSSVNKMYVYFLSGWWLMSSLQNASPSGITGNAAIYDLAADGTPTTVTLSSSDPEGFPISWSHSVISGSLGGTTVTNVNNVFTITPSTDAADAGTFTLRFAAADGQGGESGSQSNFTLDFVFIVTNSKYTSLLMSANAAGTNSSFTNSGSGSSAVKGATNNPSAGTFSPFRAGGYSVEFDGNDYLKVADSSDFHISSSADFTLEAWVYMTDLSSDNMLIDTRPSGTQGDYITISISASKLVLYSQSAVKLTSTASISTNEWVHVAYVRASNTGRWYINGTPNVTWTDNIAYHTSAGGADWWIGARQNATGSYFNNAKIRDFRFVNGTAIVPPSGGPTERLTAVTNTKLLACSSPNFADANTQVAAKTITISGDPKTVPSGPYDVGETQLSDGGSIHFDAVGTSGHADAPIEIASVNDGGANHTVSFWYYFTGTGTSGATSKGNIYTYGDEQGNVGYGIQHNNANNGQIIFMFGASPYETVLVTSGAKHSQWNYVQVIKTGTTVRCYLNGVLGTGSGSRSSDYSNGAAELNIGAERYGGMSNLFRGYISDLQYINSASTDYSVPTALRSSTGTVVHLKGQTASISDKSQSTNLELDGSTTGHATRKDGAAWAGTFSTYFGGSTGDNAFARKFENLGSNFTVECWAYAVGTGTQVVMASIDDIGSWSGAGRYMFVLLGGKYQLYIDGGTSPGSQTTAATLNTWQHVAVTKSGSTVTYYLDGIQNGSFTNSLDLTNPSGISIGSGPNNNWIYNWGGYIQDLRISRSVRYTAADESANIPTAPLEG